MDRGVPLARLGGDRLRRLGPAPGQPTQLAHRAAAAGRGHVPDARADGQAEALAPVAAKTRAPLMVGGELPKSGWPRSMATAAMSTWRWPRLRASGEGVDGRAQSLEALFADARRSEDEADELRVVGG
ncbi:MAG TPA: hypothetical protein VEL76_27635 [Gemmataceae bacterium]|nr:hypothetical protein [Gemmataceae bacterium]